MLIAIAAGLLADRTKVLHVTSTSFAETNSHGAEPEALVALACEHARPRELLFVPRTYVALDARMEKIFANSALMACTFANADGAGRGERVREATSNRFFNLKFSNGSYSPSTISSRRASLCVRSLRAAINGGFSKALIVSLSQ